MRQTFVVPVLRKLPTPNDRLHWGERARRTKQIREETFIRLRNEMAKRRVKRAEAPREMELEVLRGPGGGRQLDVDNMVASMKVIIDACVDAGLLVKDDPRWLVGLRIRQQKVAEPGLNLRITVWDGQMELPEAQVL